MATKQTAIRFPVGILEAIDARRDADNDRTAVIISLLTSALTGEYIKPKENTAQVIGKLTTTVKSLEAAIDELSFQIKKQTRINSQVDTSPIVESTTVSGQNNFIVDNTTNSNSDDDEDFVINDSDFKSEADDQDEDISDEEPDYQDVEANSEPIQFTHQEFIDSFGCCRSSGFVAVLVDGDMCELVIADRNVVLVIDPHSREEKRLSTTEIAYYRAS